VDHRRGIRRGGARRVRAGIDRHHPWSRDGLRIAPGQGVEVKASSYQGRVTKIATTDKGGRFTIIFINGEGDYWLEMRKLGFSSSASR
jgi:hypothetical protein